MEKNGVLWKLLFDQLSDGICISSPSGPILYLNPAAVKMLGATPEQLSETHLCQVLCGNMHTAEGKDCAAGCPLREINSPQKAITLKGQFALQDEASRKGLRVRCLNMPTVLLEGENQHNNFTVIEDISAEVELEKHREDWRSMIAHDLRAPITAILAALRVLQDIPAGGKMEKGDKEILDISIRSCKRLSELVDIYLDVAKLEAGMTQVHPEKINVQKLIGGILGQWKSLAESKKINLVIKIPEYMEAMADADLLSRISDNLLSNAIKFTPAGGEVSIEGILAPNRKIRLLYTDTGVGIAPEDLPKIFDRFYQAAARHEGKTRGTGLGLTFCQEAAKAMGGSVEIKSEIGRGSQFILELPAP